MFTLFKKI